MSANPEPTLDTNAIEQVRKHVNRLVEEIAHLSEMELAPAEYYGEFLQRVMQAVAAPAGAIWLRTPQGNLQLQYQINMREVKLDATPEGKASHDELLRQAIMRGQPGIFMPGSSHGTAENGAPLAGNPSQYCDLLAPILVEKQVAGEVEIWQNPNHSADAQRGFLQFMVRMAALASNYTRNHQLRQMSGQQQVWTQLESFTRLIHNSLNPTEVAYVVANEGRRLAECDRISVALRLGRRCQVEAISGADVVEKRSNLVQLMRALFDSVVQWGEKLIYSGTKDETLPPKVLNALDAYLAESNSKLLVILPLRDEREAESTKPPRSALLMESFEPATAPEQLVARLEVIGRHSASALYNAAEHRRIPMRFLWMPLAKLQDGLGGKAKAIAALVGFSLGLIIALLIFMPYPLKMEANGQLRPKDLAILYTPVEAKVVGFSPNVRPGAAMKKDQETVEMYSLELGSKIRELQAAINAAEKQVEHLERLRQGANNQSDPSLQRDLIEQHETGKAKKRELEVLRSRTNPSSKGPGYFWLKAPIEGIILSADFEDTLKNRSVKPNEPLLRIGKIEQDPNKRHINEWEIELKIPQKNIGQVLSAYPKADPAAELEVDLLITSKPTRSYKGKIARHKIAAEASPDRNERNESEPVVIAWVRVSGSDIPPESQLPLDVLVTGTEVRSRVRCGNRPMGYSLFYGVWEFLYERVIFPYF